jgi:hypothetical protein
MQSPIFREYLPVISNWNLRVDAQLAVSSVNMRCFEVFTEVLTIH